MGQHLTNLCWTSCGCSIQGSPPSLRRQPGWERERNILTLNSSSAEILFFQFKIIINSLVLTYARNIFLDLCYGFTSIISIIFFTSFSAGTIFRRQNRRQILRSKICPDAVKIFYLPNNSLLLGTKCVLSPLTAGPDYISFLYYYWHIKYQLLNMLKIKRDINQQYFNTIGLHFVKHH